MYSGATTLSCASVCGCSGSRRGARWRYSSVGVGSSRCGPGVRWRGGRVEGEEIVGAGLYDIFSAWMGGSVGGRMKC